MPIYGKGINLRDWLYSQIHCCGIIAVIEKRKVGEVSNLDRHNEGTNTNIAKRIISEIGKSKNLINYVADRYGRYPKYAIEPRMVMSNLGWNQ